MASTVKIAILGAGGHGRVIAQCITACATLDNSIQLAGFIDPFLAPGTSVGNSTVLGGDDAISELITQQKITHFIVGLGTIRGGVSKRQELYNAAIGANLKPATIIAPSAIVSPDVNIGLGTAIMPAAVVNTGTVIGSNVIINTRASIDHDAQIKDDVHIAPGCVLSGDVTVGKGSLVGVGATIIQGVTIGQNTTIGAGSVVTKDIGDNLTAVGVPHRVISRD